MAVIPVVDCSELSWRPAELAAAEQVQMQVKDRLACACTVVEDRAVAFQKVALAGQFRRDEMQLTDYGLIFRASVIQ
jgi:hypothetical protein